MILRPDARPSGKPFENDCDLLNELVPHLARSFAVRRAIAEARNPAPAIAAAAGARARCRVVAATLCVVADAGPPGPVDRPWPDRERSIRPARHHGGTTRQYLRRIFDKTGVRRQSDLVRIIGR